MFSIYLKVVWSDVVARMSSIASLLFTAGAVYSQTFNGQTGPQYARYFWWCAAGVCFVIANYRAWADEHEKRISSEPKFEMTIEQAHWEYSETNKNTVLIFAVNLVNKGAPSITRGWKGGIEINGIREEMNFIHLAGKWVITNNNQRVNLLPKDQITAKTSERRVETGEGKAGRVFFTLSGNRMDVLNTKNFKACLAFHDFTGKPCTQIFVPHPSPLVGVSTYSGEEGEIISSESVEELTSNAAKKILSKPKKKAKSSNKS
jgi:hypothetical protein